MPSLTRRRFFQVAAGVATTGALALSDDATILEPHQPIVIAMEIVLPRLPAAFNGFTIAQLSDFHYDEYFSAAPIKTAIEMVNNLRPDMVVLTGDFVTVPMFHRRFHTDKRAALAAEPCAGLLVKLQPRLGTISVLGNHDVGSDPRRIIDVFDSPWASGSSQSLHARRAGRIANLVLRCGFRLGR